MDSRQIIRFSEIVFIQVAGLNMFKRHPMKKNMVDKYYTIEEVIHFMNAETLKVCITDRDHYVIEKNFDL